MNSIDFQFEKHCDYSIVLSTENGNKFVSVMQMSALNDFGVPSLALDTDGTFGIELLHQEGTYDECHSLMIDLIREAKKVSEVQVLENPDKTGDKRFQVYVGTSVPDSEIGNVFDISDDNEGNLVGEVVDTTKYLTVRKTED